MKTITENKFKVIAECEVREIELQLEGDAQLNVYKSILLRFDEDGENPIWLHDSAKREGVRFYYENLYNILEQWGYDYNEVVDYALKSLPLYQTIRCLLIKNG
tara:strand:+ start:455 stop:763 length:309 start_codon:yes stop_codon:yes gene_type:complete